MGINRKCRICLLIIEPRKDMRTFFTLTVFALATISLLGGCGKEDTKKDWELVRTIGAMQQIVVVDKNKETNEQIYKNAIRALCIPGKHCYVQFWSDRLLTPDSFPLTDAQLDARNASYLKNPTSGLEEFNWDCRIKNEPGKCIH
jgi:hypothetical protein